VSNRLSFVAGVIAGMGRARRRIALIAFLAGLVAGILLGVGSGIGVGLGVRPKIRHVRSEARSLESESAGA
jgi:hypothetical protein